MIYKPVPTIISEIVSEVRSSVGLKNGAPYFDFGTTNEVVNRLMEKTNSPDLYSKKYPLIWMLINDALEEDVQPKLATPRLFKDLTIIFCTETKSEYTSAERYEKTIMPILRPLYESFMYYLGKNQSLISDNYNHGYYENLFWGRNGVYGREGNVFNDRIDAIIIDNLDLRVKQTC